MPCPLHFKISNQTLRNYVQFFKSNFEAELLSLYCVYARSDMRRSLLLKYDHKMIHRLGCSFFQDQTRSVLFKFTGITAMFYFLHVVYLIFYCREVYPDRYTTSLEHYRLSVVVLVCDVIMIWSYKRPKSFLFHIKTKTKRHLLTIYFLQTTVLISVLLMNLLLNKSND